MDSENNVDLDSENEFDIQEHKRVVANLLNLNTKQHIKKPVRTELTSEISEYNLVKSITSNRDSVRLHDLTRSLKNRSGDAELRKKIKKTEVKSKTLVKPLEKPQADRIKRSTAYESTKKQLDRWEPVVTANRVSTNLSFPLKDPNFKDYKEAKDFTSNWVLKSNLEKELEKLEPKVETYNIETEDKFPMTVKEMVERRKEIAKLRRYQNYKEIKTRWQNKIKSKKFRRILRKEKIKEQMKQFESLQKTNPEEALKKLEEIEKARAEERASLRHKSTGKWARNQQIRAKYDKESRKVLAEQLSISKNLLQKQKVDESSESEDYENDTNIVNPQNTDNPWVNNIKPAKEVEEFLSSYRKFWESQNNKSSTEILDNSKNDNLEMENDKTAINSQTVNDSLVASLESIKENTIMEEKNSKNELDNIRNENKIVNNDDKILSSLSSAVENKSIKTKHKKRKLIDVNTEKETANKLAAIKEHKTTLEIDATSEVWEVTTTEEEDTVTGKKVPSKKRRKNRRTDKELLKAEDALIDNIFDGLQQRIQFKADQKYKQLKSKIGDTKSVNKKSKLNDVVKNDKENRNKEEKQKNIVKTVPNQEIPQNVNPNTENDMSAEIQLLKSIINTQPPKSKPTGNIDPNKFIKTKPIDLDTDIPDLLTYDDNEEATDQRDMIAEAFQDDDIVEEFAKDKKDAIDKDKPQDIDLSLPGWGSWGGQNLTVPKKKPKRFIIKFPKQVPRKDMNKGDLIINESANDNIKSHMVAEVPFPFKTVKDFEASLRAPIGNTFVPETAFKKMIEPNLKTKMGTIIEPITEDILLYKEKKQKKRIK